MREAYAGSRVDDAFSRFDMLERQADLAEGRADALALGAPPKTLEEDELAALSPTGLQIAGGNLDQLIAELRNEDKVASELEAMKARLDTGPNTGGEG